MPRISEYSATGPADVRSVRAAGLIDLAVAAAVAMLAFPFPFVRATLPLPLFVTSIVIAILVFDTAYRTMSLRIWGRTPGMYLLDLGVSEARPLPLLACATWAVAWTAVVMAAVAGLPRPIHPERGLPATLSGLRTVSTRAR